MTFLETSVFTRCVQNVLTDDSYHRLQLLLIHRPDTGVVIPGSGGLRKMRWSPPGTASAVAFASFTIGR